MPFQVDQRPVAEATGRWSISTSPRVVGDVVRRIPGNTVIRLLLPLAVQPADGPATLISWCSLTGVETEPGRLRASLRRAAAGRHVETTEGVLLPVTAALLCSALTHADLGGDVVAYWSGRSVPPGAELTMVGPLAEVPALIEEVGMSPELVVGAPRAEWGVAISLDLLAGYVSVPSDRAELVRAFLDAEGLDVSYAALADPVDE
ncbi:MAG: hypothetical protein QOG34_1848 [Frankiaceae bacterium]|jgi:hypothetical protein|nr:hypothetical protein [Frankiaceae bacterium]